jgi:hypothetical protein
MPIQSIFSSLREHARARGNTSIEPNTDKLGWRLAEVGAKTWDLGFTAFGGPPVHFQILHRRFVEGLGFGGSKWIDEQTVSISILAVKHGLNFMHSIKSCSQYAKLSQALHLQRWFSVSQ